MNHDEFPFDKSQLKDAHRVAYLIAGHIKGTLTPLERRELDEWVEADERNVELFEELTDEDNIQKALAWYNKTDTEKALKKLHRRLHFPAGSHLLSFWRWAGAIAALLILVIGMTFLIERKKPVTPNLARAQEQSNDRKPGTNQAILTLSDGRELFLDQNRNGNIAVQGNTQVLKKENSLAYNTRPQLGIAQEPAFNTLTTPRGGVYSLVLPDGSRVWLNAASSLHFPTAFTGHQRVVELTGEGYFEVAKDPARPFLIQVNNTRIKVLGTHFNVNAYADEGFVRTTLIEGSVEISQSSGASKKIIPGEDAISDAIGIKVEPSDKEKVMGWHEGNFVFHNTPMKSVLKEIERWYSVEVINAAGNKNHLNGTFPRTVPLSKLLAYLQETKSITFKWENDNLIVIK
ncbi:MAG: FecR domain-containing protein [Flavisolibacter sp.]